VLYGNNAGPWRRLPAIRLTHGLTAPSSTDVSGQPPPFSRPQGTPARGYLGTNLCEGNDDAELGPEKAMLRVATIELVRALITTAAQDELGQRVLHDTLYLRVSKYVDAHLTDPDLNAESIALAHNVSVRTLYNAWSAANQVPLSQWIIAARLEGARAQLSGGTSAMTIAAIARRWGFSDATHFARRFRSAYGLSPREWRQLHLPSADGRTSVDITGHLL
jgi:AraC-like DNA-binding protein